jgi:WhiB family redox-sensing transcriptional regulator
VQKARRRTGMNGTTADRSHAVEWGEHPLDELGVLAELFDDPEEQEWQEQALCAQTDPEAFFPEKGGSTREAKRICQGCEVRAECLEYALAHDERFGIWGGLSERERRKLKKRAG